ncbi:tyrosine protein kinase [Hymenobacter frigidus]|uniref:non-specific protein-tyrosine kinase n=1 Tax=Hymenobacter frigidus TaxID=1524095 RepID=A0ABQ2A8X7_9BACT|nr:polysaccharide biosynthesis tyrosine autokinase [Hymenobacter frigidus]GGH86788.1 tyrosine protein kinase [Hymenobacter frigidus]
METRPSSDEIDLHALFFKLRTRWPLFVLALALAVGGAYLYWQMKAPVYAFRATMLLGDQGTGSKQTQELLQLLQVRDKGVKMEDEIGVLTSGEFVRQAVAKLPYAVSYYAQPRTWLNQLRPLKVRERPAAAVPFQVWVDLTAPQLTGVPIYVEPAGPGRFRLRATAPKAALYSLPTSERLADINDAALDQTGTWGDTLRTRLLTAVLQRMPGVAFGAEPTAYYFVLNDLNGAAGEYQSSLAVRPIDHESRIIELSAKNTVPAKGVQFLDTLMAQYIASDLNEKDLTGRKTLAFLNQEIDKISGMRRQSAEALASFRATRGVLDVAAQSTSGIQRMSGLEIDRAQVAMRRKYYQNMLAYLRANRNASQVASPSSAGIEDPVLNSLIMQLTNLNEKRAELTATASGDNPLLTVLDGRIRNTKESLIQTLANMSQANDIALRDLDGQLGQVRGQMSQMPESERQLSSLKSTSDFNEKNYNFLVDKRNEAAIALATNATDKKIIDPAQQASSEPESPKPVLVGLLALLVGLLLPTGVVLVLDKANRRIQGRDDLAEVTTIPLLGVVAHGSKSDKISMLRDAKGPIAESFRSIRVNLQYLAAGLDKKVLGVTSSIPGEGKTFCAVNIAAELAMSGRRVMLVETDLRRPTVASYFDLDPTPAHGLASYLTGASTLDEACRPSGIAHLDVLTCGHIPSNPTELLEGPRMAELLTQLRAEYDYVVLDTPPVGFVAEYFVLVRFLDANIYVVRHNYTERGLVSQIDELHRTQRIKQLYMIINDMHFDRNYEYRYKSKAYAYGY